MQEEEEYLMAALYVYPSIGRMERDYSDHIKNRAVLSYRYSGATEALCEKIARDIGEKERLKELKERLDAVLGGLTEEEKFLLELRYFGRRERLTAYAAEKDKYLCSKRQYYRKQDRLLLKIGGLLAAEGMCKEAFSERYGECEFFAAVCRALEEGRTAKREAAAMKRLGIKFSPEKGYSSGS